VSSGALVTTNVPQFAILLLPPQLAVAVTAYVFSTGLVQLNVVGAQIISVTVVVPHLTVGFVRGVPATTGVVIAVHVSSSAGGTGSTINSPVQVAVMPLQTPEVAFAFMLVYVFATGLVQFGVLAVFAVPDVQVRLAGSTVVPSLQVTAGGVIAVPAMPDEGTAAQVSTGAIMFKGLGVHVASGALLIPAVEPHFTFDTFMVLVPTALYVVEPPVACHAIRLAGETAPEGVKIALPLSMLPV